MSKSTLDIIGTGKYWQALELGIVGRTLRRTITETDLVNFISVTGMLEAIFIDAQYEHAAIPGRLVPAALTQSIIEGLLFQTLIQGTGLALLEVHTEAHLPVRVNDSIWATCDIKSIKPTSKLNRAIVVAEVKVYNQNHELVLTYRPKRLLAGDPGADS